MPSGEQQCPLGLMSLYRFQQPLLSKMNYRSPHSSESVICAQPAGHSNLLVAVVMDVNFHCWLLAPNSPGFTTQNNVLKTFMLSPRTCKLHIRSPPPPFFFFGFKYSVHIELQYSLRAHFNSTLIKTAATAGSTLSSVLYPRDHCCYRLFYASWSSCL